MTEKQFKYNVNTDAIERDDKFFAYLNVVNVNRIVDFLNEFAEENKELKKENKELRQYLGWQEMELEELEDINKNVIE